MDVQHWLDRLRAWWRPAPEENDLGLVLSGGGARAAYQAGVLHYIAEAFPETRFSILTGVSAGAINTAHLANHTGPLGAAAGHLVESWQALSSDEVFLPASSFSFVRTLVRSSFGGSDEPVVAEEGARRGLVDTAPLRAYLERQLNHEQGRLAGIPENLRRGDLKAAAIITTNYQTGQTVTWVQGRDIVGWERPNRVGINTSLTIDHIMASTALPLLFPAVRIGNAWYGDGGIRLVAPLSPAVHLGAERILVISTRYSPSRSEATEPVVTGYPPAAQIAGLLMDAVFLDVLDHDAQMMARINKLIRALPARKREGLRPVELMMIRPSVDLGRLSGAYESRMEGVLGLLTIGMGTRESERPDWLSMLLFEAEYLARLIEIGYDDARRQRDRLAAFLSGEAAPGRA